MKLVLDTNVYADYAEGIAQIVDFLAVYGEHILIPSIVVGELMYGFMHGSRQRFNEKKLQQFIKRLKVDIIDVNVDIARKYALIYRSLRKKGTKIPINDVWIAACCMEAGGTLITRDEHFEFIDQIECVVP